MCTSAVQKIDPKIDQLAHEVFKEGFENLEVQKGIPVQRRDCAKAQKHELAQCPVRTVSIGGGEESKTLT